jgi:tetratricopeptide (TPR) repeat protein
MGFQMRKSFKVAPGVRITASKSGISASAGVPGARISKSTSGRTTKTVGIPGSGIRHTTSSTSSSRSRSTSRAAAHQPQAPAPAKPGLLSPAWHRALYKAVQEQRFGNLEAIATKHPESAVIVATIDGLMRMTNEDNARAAEILRYVWDSGQPIDSDPFVAKYLHAAVTINIAHGVEAAMPMGRDAVGLALAELEQEVGRVDAAIAVVEAMEPSTVAAVSLADLYLEAGRPDDIVDITNGVSNTDDATALLSTFRGCAFREQGNYTASREAFKDALKSKSRQEGVRHFALVERAKTYTAEGKKGMARKDLERVLAENANYENVRELLAELDANG